MRLAYVLAAAGCYAAHAPSDVPCASNGACPSGQVCDLSQSPPSCVDHLGDPPGPGGAPDASSPGGPGASVWGTPTLIANSVAGADDDPTLTADLLELYFNRANDIYAMTRPTATAPWGAPVVVAELSTAFRESTPELSPDGLTIYLSSDRPGSDGTDIWVATRRVRTAPWGPLALATGLNSAATDRCAAPTSDPDLIVLASDRSGDYDLYESRRTGGVWSRPVPIAAANAWIDDDSSPFLAADGRTIYFFSDRDGDADLFEAARSDPAQLFAAPRSIRELATTDDEVDPWVSPDQRHLIFVRNDTLYEAAR